MQRKLVPVNVIFKGCINRPTIDDTIAALLATGVPDSFNTDLVASREFEFMVPPRKAAEFAHYVRDTYGKRVASVHAPGNPGYHFRKY